MPPQETIRRAAKQRELYGFICWTGSILGYAAYMLWAFLPARVLHTLGVEYFPNKWLAVAVPAVLILTAPLAVVAYVVRCAALAPAADSMLWLTDARARAPKEHSLNLRAFESGGIPPVHDIPVSSVSALLYEPRYGGRERSDLLGRSPALSAPFGSRTPARHRAEDGARSRTGAAE